ncbi:PREDICTED: uncharacterized protein LOC108748908 [Trachymyrmex septentrionalis]|nr:PREDICTED: uncharacterized protein LOC108748908 [Trachymyrmex septentrionalis]
MMMKCDEKKREMFSRRACSESGPHPGIPGYGNVPVGGHLWGKRNQGRTSAPIVGHARPPAIILRTRRSWPVAPTHCRRDSDAEEKGTARCIVPKCRFAINKLLQDRFRASKALFLCSSMHLNASHLLLAKVQFAQCVLDQRGAEVGGAWSCCLPCAGGGGGGGGVDVSGATPETKKGSLLKHHYQEPHQQQRSQQHEHQQQQKALQQEKQYLYQPPKRICVAQFKERAPLGDLDEDLDDLDDEEKECELRIGEEEDYGREGSTQHRLSPRLHDIEEEDDEEGRHIRERPYQPKKSPTPSGSRSGWRSRRSITTAGAPGGHQHHVIATAAATAQARMQAEQGSIGELRGYHNLRSRRHTLANVR